MAWIKGILSGLRKLKPTKLTKAEKAEKAVIKTPKLAKATEIASTTKKATKLTEELRTMRTATGRVAGEVPKAIRSVSKSAKTNIGAITGAGIGAGLGLLAGSILVGSAKVEEGKEDHGTTEEHGKNGGFSATISSGSLITAGQEEAGEYITGDIGGSISKAEEWAEEALTGIAGWPVVGDLSKSAIEKRQALPFLILLIGGIAIGGYAIYKVAFARPARARAPTVKVLKPVVVSA